MKESTLEGLRQRLARLEHENRRLRRVGVAVAVGVAALVVMGQARSTGRVIEAEQFVIRDATEKTRAKLAVLPDGRPGLFLHDRDGNPRIQLAVLPAGNPGIALYDANGKIRSQLAMTPDGRPVLLLHDRDGKVRAELGLAAEGTPSLFLRDRDGKVTWRAP